MQLTEGLHRQWDGWLENVDVMKIQERSFCMRSKNDTGEPTIVFSVALPGRAVASVALRQGSHTCAPGPSCWQFCTMGQWCLCFSGWAPQGHFLPFHIKKRGERESDHWDAQGQVGSSHFALRPWRWYHSVLPTTLSQSCFYWIKHLEERFGLKREVGIQFWQ